MAKIVLSEKLESKRDCPFINYQGFCMLSLLKTIRNCSTTNLDLRNSTWELTVIPTCTASFDGGFNCPFCTTKYQL